MNLNKFYLDLDFVGENVKFTDAKDIFKFRSGITEQELEKEFIEFCSSEASILDWTSY